MAAVDIVKVSILGKDSIHVGYNLLQHIVDTCLTQLPSSNYALITDTHIAPLYLDQLARLFQAGIDDKQKFKSLPANARFISKLVAPGETSKSRKTKEDLEDWLLSERCTRDTIVIALGGGVIGDMVGFVAATFMRGVKFVQVPTTLLAMVDSAIGGKTAVDTPLGKNLIGSFHQPEFIFEDLAFLNTLPNREFINGMAEVIKTAAIWNEDRFGLLEQAAPEILQILSQPVSKDRFNGIRQLLQDVVISSIHVKAEVVSADEKEGGLRNLLNFGHSIGHAYEAILTPEILHGEAVSIGMVKEAELSRLLGHLSPDAVGRISKCLSAWGLPTRVDDEFITSKTRGRKTPVDRLLQIMAIDKKNSGSSKRVVLLKRVGECYELKATDVQDHFIRLVLAPHVSVQGALESPQVPREVVCKPPGSKSISNRALILAALSGGRVKLTNLLSSDDTRYMQSALEALGAASFTWNDDGSLLVSGTGRFKHPSKELFLGNAGTAARFLTSVACLVNSTESVVLTGNHRMKVRPIGPLVDALRSNGTTISYLAKEGCLPLSILPGFQGGRIELSASVSSQYVSSILMAAPLARKEVHLVLTGGQVISELYIDMTTAMMASFGVQVEKISSSEYKIPVAQYVAPEAYEIESDASSATYPLALAALLGISVVVPNIGSESLQGDARFARDVLQPMGCSIEQTATSTRVQGPAPGSLRAVTSIDMEPMTDAFLTASVLAAASQGSMTIKGIANQRVKECNRIAAMRAGLAAFGCTQSSEFGDGLTIQGVGLSGLCSPPDAFEGDGIDTHDDHRVAMSFSLLAAVTPGQSLILDKDCTSKTWPDWWDVLSRDFVVTLAGVDYLPAKPKATVNGAATVVVVGMRGAGKSTMGVLAAQILDRPFIDLDQLLEQDYKQTIPEIVATRGWTQFREFELATLSKVLKEHAQGYICACGGGIVETPAAVTLLQQFVASGGLVLQVHRDIEQIADFLGADETRPAWNAANGKSTPEIMDVWERRRPLFEQVANFQYYSSKANGLRTEQIKAFAKFLHHLQGPTDLMSMLSNKPRSFFLSLTYPDIRQGLELLQQITAGCDAVELRVDLLQDGPEPVPSIAYVSEQVALLRERLDMPIIFTIRTKSQGGNFPNDREDLAVELMCLAAKWAIEFIDFEMTWSEKALRTLRKSAVRSKIIASHHDVTGSMSFATDSWQDIYKRACEAGDLVKLVGQAKSLHDNFALEEFKTAVAQSGMPLIAINMGSQGTLSRLLSSFLTPVTHALLPFKAAPGQLSVKEIHQGLTLLGRIAPKKFFIFGCPISHSRSPALHNAGFTAFGLPHIYERLESDEIDRYASVLQSPAFGGASVTIPHKKAIMPFLASLTEEAQAIGAVNTVLPSEHGLLGDNTDWIGITRALTSVLPPTRIDNAVVFGAGGTARAAVYALNRLGTECIFVANRSASNLKDLKTAFPFIRLLHSEDDVADLGPISVVVSTVPGDAPLDGSMAAIASSILKAKSPAACLLELAYKPRVTPMMEMAKQHDWQTVDGLEVLLEQGLQQFKLWTGLQMSAQLGRDAILGNVEENEASSTSQQSVAGSWAGVA
ncbi:EPSP synthase-domain-containing protein [Protomyces lactucae-debilis]|uniref:Pentafunctional AROM polypeptide n=1 Tax=Protomyces lactucae-debilis TaxID=2754530 RepID=A0A1Y2FTB2_PROLT|nr:EPSP synthase-domain-containing protein [Protomyces lactucae-debilis]ORY86426.1 EPSP synthase-domain-containing protein [Protomyces lactucae-debilis]